MLHAINSFYDLGYVTYRRQMWWFELVIGKAT